MLPEINNTGAHIYISSTWQDWVEGRVPAIDTPVIENYVAQLQAYTGATYYVTCTSGENDFDQNEIVETTDRQIATRNWDPEIITGNWVMVILQRSHDRNDGCASGTRYSVDLQVGPLVRWQTGFNRDSAIAILTRPDILQNIHWNNPTPNPTDYINQVLEAVSNMLLTGY